MRTARSIPITQRCTGLIAGLLACMVSVCVIADEQQVVVAIETPQAMLGWVPREFLSEEHLPLPQFCRGKYLARQSQPLNDDRIEASAEQMQMQSDGIVKLNGDVEIRQYDRQLQANQASWNTESGTANLSGNVSVYGNGIVLEGASADYQQQTQQLTLRNARYALPDRHLRGGAALIDSPAPSTLNLNSATFTFCEPGNNSWDIAASRLSIDNDKGYGTATNARLRIGSVPVLYIPYYRFPIDDRRLTGFLDPSLSLNGEGQLEQLRLPFYLNLAANADATITPQHILDRGLLWQGQVRYKGRYAGDNEINYGLLKKDQTSGAERSFFNFQQQQRIGGWEQEFIYNRVSDRAYFNDLNPSTAIFREAHLPRLAKLSYRTRQWQSSVIAEGYQTIDPSIDLEDRPYRRLPQLNIEYQQQPLSGWQIGQRVSLTQFSRPNSDQVNDQQITLTGLDAVQGNRAVSDSAIGYRWQAEYGYLEPKLTYRHRFFDLNTDTSDEATDELLSQEDFSESIDFGVASVQIDGQLQFERLSEQSVFQIQTFEPRVFYRYSPYVDQQQTLPVFDSKTIDLNYYQLFSEDRFIGDDRLADTHHLSLGATSRFIDQNGREQLRLDVGGIFYRSQQRTHLNPDPSNLQNTDLKDAGDAVLVTDLLWSPNTATQFYSTVAWDSRQRFIQQRRFGLRYQYSGHRFAHISSNKVMTLNDTEDTTDVDLYQLDAGVFWSINDSWAVFTRQQIDLNQYSDDEPQPSDSLLESLAGLEYQSCCWRVQISYRESSVPSDNEALFTTEKRHGFQISVELKGLGNFGGGIDKLLEDAVPGYDLRRYHTH